MDNNSKTTTLRRKANAAQHIALEQGAAPIKALRHALTKSAEEQLAIAVDVLSIDEQYLSLREIQKEIGNKPLILKLDGLSGFHGLAVIDTQILTGLIEAQTIGYVANKKAIDRKPTKTDAAMCEVFLNATLDKFTETMQENQSVRWGLNYQTGQFVQSTRLLELVLEDVIYAVNRVKIDLANGAKQGEIFLIFPKENKAPDFTKASEHIPDTESWKTEFLETVSNSKVQINAVLFRSYLPLERIINLQIGDNIEIPLTAIAEMRLEGVGGQSVVSAKLGQQDGYRAARLSDSISSTAIAADSVHLDAEIMEQPISKVPELDMTETADLPVAQLPTTDFPSMENLPQVEPGNTSMPIADIDVFNSESPIGLPLQLDSQDLEIAFDQTEPPDEFPIAAMPLNLEIG